MPKFEITIYAAGMMNIVEVDAQNEAMARSHLRRAHMIGSITDIRPLGTFKRGAKPTGRHRNEDPDDD